MKDAIPTQFIKADQSRLEMKWPLFYVGMFTLLFLLYCLVRLVQLLLSDCDLQLRACAQKPVYFKNKVVWLVGASGGIGEQLSLQLSALGARLILSGLPAEEGAMVELKQRLARQEGVRILPLDLTESKSLPSKVEQATEAFGHIDILILAAGILQFGYFKDILPEVDRMVMEVNYFGQRTLIQAVLPGMLQMGSGHIVGVSSLAGRVWVPYSSSYAAAKSAFCALLEAVRLEMHNKNIKVTTVCPSSVKTGMCRKSFIGKTTQEDDRDVTDLVALSRIGALSPERCAELILIATSNEMKEVWVGAFPIMHALYLGWYTPALYTPIRRKLAALVDKAMADTEESVRVQ